MQFSCDAPDVGVEVVRFHPEGLYALRFHGETSALLVPHAAECPCPAGGEFRLDEGTLRLVEWQLLEDGSRALLVEIRPDGQPWPPFLPDFHILQHDGVIPLRSVVMQDGRLFLMPEEDSLLAVGLQTSLLRSVARRLMIAVDLPLLAMP